MKSFSFITGILLVFFVTLSACGEADSERSAAADGAGQAPAGAGGLTPEQLEKGIGPIQQVSLGDVEAALAERGEEIFSMKCTACRRAGC